MEHAAKPMPCEMLKLREELDGMGVAWVDASDEAFCSDLYGLSRSGYAGIYRTWWETERHRYSAICGLGSYGSELDLLELMVDNDEPSGFLDCSNVIEIFKKTELG